MILDRLRALLPTGAFARGVVTMALGTGVAQLIVLFASPILTRLYDPSDYGTFAVALSLIAVLITVTCLRYEFAIPLPPDDRTAANLVALSISVNLVFCLTAWVVLWLAGASLLGALGASALAPYLLIIPISQFAGGLASALTNLSVRAKAYPDISRARLTQSSALVAIQVILGIVSLGALGLLVGDATGRIAGAFQLGRIAWQRHVIAFRSVSRSGMAAAARRYRRFPIYSSGSALIATLGIQAPLLFLVAFYGAEAGGIYALAARVSAIPLTLVAYAVGQVFIAEAAHLARSEPAAVRPLFSRTTRSLARMAIGPAILGMIVAPLLAGPVFGAFWAQAGVFVAILIPSYYAEFVAGATGDVLFVVERQDLHLVREVIRFTLIGLAIPLAAWLRLPILGAIVMLSAAGIVTYVLYGIISWRAVRNFRPGQHAADDWEPPRSNDDPGTTTVDASV